MPEGDRQISGPRRDIKDAKGPTAACPNQAANGSPKDANAMTPPVDPLQSSKRLRMHLRGNLGIIHKLRHPATLVQKKHPCHP